MVSETVKGKPGRRSEVRVRVEAFRWTRKLRGMSQAALAEKARAVSGVTISEAFVAQIETRRRQPSRENALAFAAALDCPVEVIADLLDVDGNVIATATDEAAAS